MNRRILKKLCKKAAALFPQADFDLKTKGEHCDISPNFPKREINSWGSLRNGLLKNTPLYWYRCSYEYAEYDCISAWELLVEVFSNETLEFDERGNLINYGAEISAINVFKWANGKSLQPHR